MRSFITIYLLLSLSLGLLLVTLNAHAAVKVEQLAQAKVPLLRNTGQEREKALAEALAQALVKMAGSQSVLNNATIQTALSQPSPYLVRSTIILSPTQMLLVEFDRVALQRLLQESGVAILPAVRPNLLVWMVEQDRAGQRQIISDLSQSEAKRYFIDQAELRAMPILFPLYDLEDASLVSLSDIWGRFHQLTYPSIDRYQSDYVLTARLLYDDENQGWQLDYALQGVETFRFDSVFAPSKKQVMSLFMARYAEYVALQYAFATGNESMRQQIELQVNQITSIAQLQQITQSLRALPMVRKIFHAQQTQAQAVFYVDILTDIDDFVAAIVNQGRLQVLRNKPGELVIQLQETGK